MSTYSSNENDLASVVRYALETTRATAVCPFHPTVTIRIGDDGAETHAYVRARRIRKNDGTAWDRTWDRSVWRRLLALCPSPPCCKVLGSRTSVRHFPWRLNEAPLATKEMPALALAFRSSRC